MNRFVRFFRKLFTPPKLSHDASRVAEKRVEIASKISDDEIYVQTVRNALHVPDATLSDKLTFAFSSLPDAPTNFPNAKNLFFDILEFLSVRNEITEEDVQLFKAKLQDINTFEELMMASS
ncbi:MAG: hypothetical protein ACXACP_07880 [Candidatus Hodarchaeales archaeon]|jgi:hypothetical protein